MKYDNNQKQSVRSQPRDIMGKDKEAAGVVFIFDNQHSKPCNTGVLANDNHH